MGVAVFGHWGPPLLAFPTSHGDQWELQRQGLLDAIADFIDAGRVKVFCVGSNNHDSFLNKGAHPFHRSWRQRMFDEYIRHEVVPFVHTRCQTPEIPITTWGASLGAYHAVNTLLRYPQVRKALEGLAGRITADAMREMNYAADAEKQNPADIARRFVERPH